MQEKIKIAVIGCGRFSPFFVPLFKAHPFVEKVYVCDLKRERAEDFAKRFDVEIIEPGDNDSTTLCAVGKAEFAVTYQENVTYARTAEEAFRKSGSCCCGNASPLTMKISGCARRSPNTDFRLLNRGTGF